MTDLSRAPCQVVRGMSVVTVSHRGRLGCSYLPPVVGISVGTSTLKLGRVSEIRA